MTEYNSLLGVRGTAPSTQRGTFTALGTYNMFLQTKGINEVTESLCDIKLMSEYDDYLVNYAKSQTTGGPLKPRTCTQYLSGTVTELYHRYPNHPILKGFMNKLDNGKSSLKWYDDLRDAVNTGSVNRFTKAGQNAYREEPAFQS